MISCIRNIWIDHTDVFSHLSSWTATSCSLCCWPCDLEWASYHSSPNNCWSLHLSLLYPQDCSVWPRLGWV